MCRSPHSPSFGSTNTPLGTRSASTFTSNIASEPRDPKGQAKAGGWKHAILTALIILCAWVSAGRDAEAQQKTSEAVQASGYWIPNGGQWPEDVLFASTGPGCSAEIWVDRLGFCLGQPGAGPAAVVRRTFAEVLGTAAEAQRADSEPELTGVEPLGHRHSFFLGRDPASWAGGLTAYAALETTEGLRVYPGERGLWVGRSPHGFRFVPLLSTSPSSSARSTRAGEPLESSTVAVIPSLGGVHGAPAVSKTIVPFAPGEWSTYFGSACNNLDTAEDCCTTADGDLIFVILSSCTRFYGGSEQNLSAPGISTSGGYPDLDFMMARFDGVSGRLEWLTRFGGSNDEFEAYVAVTPDGRIAVGGWTSSQDFPLTGDAIDSSFPPPLLTKGFVTLLSAGGDALEYSSYLGLATNFIPRAIAVDPGGRLAVGGYCPTDISPGLEAWQTPGWPDPLTPDSSLEAGLVVFRLDTMTIEYAGLLGGKGGERIIAMAFDNTGALTVVGLTGSPKQSFPKTPGTYTVPGWGSQVPGTPPPQASPYLFSTRIAPDGKAFEYSAWIGQNSLDEISLALLPDRSTVIAGRTQGTKLPVTPGVFDPTPDFDDAFLMQLTPDGKGLAWCTFLSTSGTEEFVCSLDGDSSGMLTVVTRSGLWPPVKTYGPGLSAANVAARIAPGAAKVLYSVALTEASSPLYPVGGGTLPGSRIGMAGTAFTPLFPVSPDAFDTTYSGIYDGYVAALSLLPDGIRHLEGSGSSCAAGLTLGATRPAWPGQADFSLYLSGGPPSGLGVLAIGAHSAVPVDVGGALSWVDPASGPALLPMQLGPQGFRELPLPIPVGLSGGELAVQAFLLPPPGCGQPLLSSHGLAIRLL